MIDFIWYHLYFLCHIYINEVLFGTYNSNYIITVCLPSSYMKTIYSIIIIIVKFTPLEIKN